MVENLSDSFNRLIWHDSKLRALRILRKADLDEVHLDVDFMAMSGQEFTPLTVVLEDALFFFSDIDLQLKRECSDDISNAKCAATSDLITKLHNERLKLSPDALARYLHFRVYLIPLVGTIDVLASGFRLKERANETGPIRQPEVD